MIHCAAERAVGVVVCSMRLERWLMQCSCLDSSTDSRRAFSAASFGPDALPSHTVRAVWRRWRGIGLASIVTLAVPLFSGCGGIAANQDVSGSLVISQTTIAFSSVPVGQTAAATVTVSNGGGGDVTISQLSVTGSSFSLSGQGNLPVTLSAGA